jgi:hypothetical protein
MDVWWNLLSMYRVGNKSAYNFDNARISTISALYVQGSYKGCSQNRFIIVQYSLNMNPLLTLQTPCIFSLAFLPSLLAVRLSVCHSFES